MYQKGVIRNVRFPAIRHEFVYDHNSRKGTLRLSYGKYNGGNNYIFSLTPGQPTELHYDVEVEAGSVVLSIKMGKRLSLIKNLRKAKRGRSLLCLLCLKKVNISLLFSINKQREGAQPAEVNREAPVNS